MPRDLKAQQRDWGKKETYRQVLPIYKDRDLVQNRRGPDAAGPVQEPLENGSPRQQSQRGKLNTKGHRQQLYDTCFQTTTFKFHSDIFF